MTNAKNKKQSIKATANKATKAIKQAVAGVAIDNSLLPLTTTALAIIPQASVAIKAKPIKAPVALSDEKQLLNAAFIAKMPNARPIFQAKYKPLNLAAHKPQNPSERDYAFISALKAVYGNKAFTHKQCGADAGNLSRAINLNLITLCDNITSDNQHLYKLVSNIA